MSGDGQGNGQLPRWFLLVVLLVAVGGIALGSWVFGALT